VSKMYYSMQLFIIIYKHQNQSLQEGVQGTINSGPIMNFIIIRPKNKKSLFFI
jgi:hypothetical protein